MNLSRLGFGAVCVILILMVAWPVEAQVGPDAYKPVVETTTIKGKVIQKSRKPRYPYEAYKNYKFDSDSTLSGRTDLTKVSEVEPFAHRRFGGTVNEDLSLRTDNFRNDLLNAPTAKGYIVVYAAAGKRQDRLLQQAFGSSLKDYLMKYGIEASRIITVDGGFSDDLRPKIEFWMTKSPGKR